jgi:UDP-N-acetyl-D-glucosamine/UDP-N-acetyl-D-galactosamine dehydrogenase
VKKTTLCVIGLGYVGLPLAHAFSKKGHLVHGFDISQRRVDELKAGHDRTRELSDEQLKEITMTYNTDPAIMKQCEIIIVAVPTPVDDNNNPDLSPVENASITIGRNISKGTIVVFESTVYPGVTEEICGAIIERESGLKCGVDFFLGYSPERINPGDKLHTVDKIIKIVGGQDQKTTDILCDLYGSIITAGIHRASSIKVAEMGKAIENAQRDINIAFINEIAMLCNKIGIPTKDVLAAAGTKWNFLKFTPGLVGGHCIGVDPYYLVEKARMLDMKTHVIAAGRGVNDSMGPYVAHRVTEALKKTNGKRVLVLGLTFKEHIPDTRNSKSFDVVRDLAAVGCDVEAHDPCMTDEDYARLNLTGGSLAKGPYDAVVFLVPHKEYLDAGTKGMIAALQKGGIIFDLKSLLDANAVAQAGATYLAL